MAPRKGRLDSILLSDLLANLAESQATGMLTVSNDAETRKVVLDHGQVMISRTGMSDKVMLGDLLIARGLVIDEDIEQALTAQRTSDKRLGEILMEIKGLTQEQVDGAVKFQVEEELLDLFTWRKGEFEFTDVVSEEEKAKVAEKGTAFAIDIRKLVEESGKRAEEWRQHEQRITSPYLVFRPTEKALTPAVQKELEENALKKRVFKWVQENRTVDTMVCKSCIGRNALYKLLIGWIDERNIELVPVGELKFLASEHRSRHRYYDAMGIYRRLREAARNDGERRDLESAIADTKAAMEVQRSQQKAEAIANQTAALAHVKRATVLKRQRLVRSILVYGVGGTVALAGLLYAAIMVGTDHGAEYNRLLEDLDNTIRVQMEGGKVESARAACEELKAHVPDLAEPVDQRLAGIDQQHRAAADKKRQEIKDQLGVSDLNDLHTRLDELQERYKDIPGFDKKVQKDKEELDREAAVRTALLLENSVNKWLLIGAVAQSQGEYMRARQADVHAASLVADKSPVLAEVQKRLAAMDASVEAQRAGLVAAAAIDRADGDLAAALKQYEAVAAMQPKLSYAALAESRAGELRAELAKAAEIFKSAQVAAGDTDAAAAEEELRTALVKLAPYGTMAAPLQAELDKLVQKRLEVDAQIQAALKLDEQGRTDQARQKWADLLTRYKGELVRRKLTVPFEVSSNPAGAQVLVGESVLGVTPLNFRLPAEDTRPIVIHLAGFAPHTLDLNERRRLQADVTLVVEPIWTIRVSQGYCGGVQFQGSDLYILNGGELQCVRPKAKSNVFEPVGLVKLPAGDRKREAPAFASELKPASWWALQFPPAASITTQAVWVPVRDCRLVRVALNDQSQTEVRCSIESATSLTMYKNPYLRNAEGGLFVGLDGQLYQADLTSTQSAPAAVTRLKYKPVEPVMAGEEVAVAVDEAGELVRIPVGDTDSAKAYPTTQPVSGPMCLVSRDDGLGQTTHMALVVEEDGSLELYNLTDMSRVWGQPAETFAVRTLRLLEGGTQFLQTGLGGGRSMCELQPVDGGGQGRPVWSIVLEGNPVRPCASRKAVYIATDDKKLHAYSLKDGSVLWESPIPGLPERIEASADGVVALVVKSGETRSVLIYAAEGGE